jgi:AcrR family transcriptional regulator
VTTVEAPHRDDRADGRVQRGARNREAIVEALLECYEAGVLRPSVPEVAARAGVSARSVHNHFADVEALRAEVARRQWERFAHLTDAAGSVDELMVMRAELYERITPVRRAALLSVHDSPTIERNLARFDRVLRRQLEALFRDIDGELLDAIELLTSWDAWNRLRTGQDCGATRARRVLTDTIRTLTEGNEP